MNNSTGPVADFTSIQAAVDVAEDGDTIIVYSGIYTENIDVNKELTITSKSGNLEDTVVQAFRITANNVTINGFKLGVGDREIRLDGAQYNNISNNEFYRIYLRSSSNNTVRNNICNGGIQCLGLFGSDNNLLSNNSFSAMEFAIFMEHSNNNILIGNSIGGEHPLWLRYSCNNTMCDNSISGAWEGIDFLYSSNNTMSNNYVSGGELGIIVSHSNNTTMNNNYVSGDQGIIIGSSSYCIMSNNTVSAHGLNGFSLSNSNNNILKDNIVVEDEHYSGWCSFYLGSSNNNILTGNTAGRTKLDEGKENIHLNNSNSNLIYNNYFNSPNNVYDDGNNIWNITKTPGTNIIGGPFLGGNYWSDYPGADTDGDGLGDTLLPHNSSGQIANGGDYLPLVIPDGLPETVHTVNNGSGPSADYTSIQAAVDAANDGDTILVYSGIYTENVDVNKELTIRSQSGNPEDTVIRVFDKEDYIFEITANNVTISGFKVEGDKAEVWSDRIYLDEVQYNNICNNELVDSAIYLVSSSNNIMSDNSIKQEYYYLSIQLEGSSNNIISNNYLGRGDYGIYMLSSSNNNTVSNNYIGERNNIAIVVSSSNNNMICSNYIGGNSDSAINLYESSNNTVDNNYIDYGVLSGISAARSSNNNKVSNNYVSVDDGAINLGYFSNNNIVSDNYVNVDDWGINLYESSNNNTVSNNRVNSSGCSIRILFSNNNVIYNNCFNGTNNAYDDGNNIWNITKTPGTNIIGGPFLGGNYWSDYEGIDTDWDGLGDTLLPYNSAGQIVNGGDYLPLVTPAGPAQAIQATIDINPGVLNPKSEGKWVTVYIGLPACYDVNDIDVSTILLMGSLPAESSSSEVGDGDCNGKPDLMVKFDRKELIALLDAENMELTVTGKMADGSMFEGSDSIRVLIKVK